MGLIANIKTAKRGITRRKTKNISAILAITLGVTLMVGIQITTDTLKNTFLTTLLMSQGEVDITITDATGGFLAAADKANITEILSDAGITPEGIMSELTTTRPILVGSQYSEYTEIAGVATNYDEAFGIFEDWINFNEKMDITDLLTENDSVLLSSELAEDLGLNKSVILPLTLQTEFNNVTITEAIDENGTILFNATTGVPDLNIGFSNEPVNLSIVGIYDGNRPGIGAQYSGLTMRLDHLQSYLSWQNTLPSFNFSTYPFTLSTIRNTDFVDSYLVALITDHFDKEIDEDLLEEKVDDLIEAVPEQFDVNLELYNIYNVESGRLSFFRIAGFMFNMLNGFLSALGLLIITTGLLLITNVQLMSVEDREFQTGVLRAVGENRRGIFQAYLLETVFQGVIGGIFGFVGGILFGWLVAFYLASLFATGQLSIIPVVNANVVILALLIGVILAIITGILPSMRASRVNIVEALRGIKVSFEEKSSRNFVLLGFAITIFGVLILLNNGDMLQWIPIPILSFLEDISLGIINPDETLQEIWLTKGWDSIKEWENIVLGSAVLFTGLGIVLSSQISRTKAINITAIALWGIPVFAFQVGLNWISDTSAANPVGMLIFAIVEIIIGSVLFVGINLHRLMRFLRTLLIRFKRFKGVAQISPALISSHKTRSTLTFAIFAVVLTLNVTVATLVATNMSGSVGQVEEDSRGVDLFVTLNKPEKVLDDTSYAQELESIDKINEYIEDIISFKTSDNHLEMNKPMINYIAFKDPDPLSNSGFDYTSDILPMRYIEIRSDQVRGNAINASDSDWRYDFYLNSFPENIQESFDFTLSDEEMSDLSRQSWDIFFDKNYLMTAYNISGGSSGFDFSRMIGSELDPDDAIQDEEGNLVQNPIIFTDSFFLPTGTQVWVPMNTSVYGFPNYQQFTVGGMLDFQRAGGFPLSPSMMGNMDFASGGPTVLGTIYIPERWSKYTNFFGEADGESVFSRAPEQFDGFLIKTNLPIDSPKIEEMAQSIEDYTNTNNEGYRELIDDSFMMASATSLYSGVKDNLQMMTQMTSFLQIYVSFGLVIGAVGMGVISIRNVAERRREIGMMRAIGFDRKSVIFSVLLELVVLGLIGLLIGVVNGLVINAGIANIMESSLIIPWDTIAIYLGFITLVAIIAGALPGWTASRIPPSEALRYVG
ncbi:MAG: FtsX-like permease family protein [Candidatus Hodarchaeales archaeon]|jgi:ABC-type antimicrobial peptide transport system permease subunit